MTTHTEIRETIKRQIRASEISGDIDEVMDFVKVLMFVDESVGYGRYKAPEPIWGDIPLPNLKERLQALALSGNRHSTGRVER